jgi:hypothetical protein
MTNQAGFFTNAFFVVQPRASEWPEVKDFLKEDYFKDVHEADEESALRRFEIIFFISLPATLFLNTALLTVVQTAETGVVSMPIGNTRLAYLYGSALLMSLGIAMEDYRRVKETRSGQGLEWRFLKNRF